MLCVDWIYVTQTSQKWRDDGNEPSGFIKYGDFLTSRGTIRFSRRTLLLVVIQLIGWLVSWLVG
jgi:hypothetical protein